MKTTIEIADALFAEAGRVAAREGRTKRSRSRAARPDLDRMGPVRLMRTTSKRSLRFLLTTAAITTACGSPASSTPTTGLTGVVVRGPIRPVCRIDVACDAPFSAGFSVQQSGREVGQFRSDADGRFTVWLPPDMYRIVPNADAPLMFPASQAKSVEVGRTGLTTVRLEFDTGIR